MSGAGGEARDDSGQRNQQQERSKEQTTQQPQDKQEQRQSAPASHDTRDGPTKPHRTLVDIAPPWIAHFLGRRPALETPVLPGLKYLSEDVESAILAFIAAFVAILLACTISDGLSEHLDSLPILIGSWGATSVLLFLVPNSPLSQPKNVIGGHVISALTGVCIAYLFSLSPRYTRDEHASPDEFKQLLPVAAALSVALASFLMQLTGTIHPPGGATALLAASRRTFAFVLLAFLSVVVMTAWACIINNLGRKKYPVYWWTPETINIRIDPLLNFGNKQASHGVQTTEKHDERRPTDLEKGRS
ncbi:hypothetical protein OIO90_000975 [Microbotryomycetes sp. JL221]|nr:hypothetical protein OIO90_000975 [Microbotryomycetes sp. JL221]